MNVLEARRRMLGAGVYKKTVTGNPAVAQGSLARMYPGIEMQGWTEQDSTTGAQLISGMINGVLINENGDINENIQNASNYRTILINVEAGSFTFSASSNIVVVKTVVNGLFESKNTPVSVGESKTYTIEKPGKLGLSFRAEPTENWDDSIKVMLNSGSAALPYEPYTGNKPSPSPEYPQEIVSAGTQNQETGKWEYEITIANAQTDATKNQTVLLAFDRPLTKWDRLEKRGGQWGWVYKSEEIESYTDGGVPGEYFSTTGQLSVGAQVWYETTEETFVPLSESEQEAMNALYTFRPTTILSNDAGCNMELTYKTRKGMGGGNPYGLEIGGLNGSRNIV